jgi:hypothetical protein
MSSDRPAHRNLVPLKKAANRAGMSVPTFRRHHSDNFVQISPGLVGVFEDWLDDHINARPPASPDNGVGATRAGPGRGHRVSRNVAGDAPEAG